MLIVPAVYFWAHRPLAAAAPRPRMWWVSILVIATMVTTARPAPAQSPGIETWRRPFSRPSQIERSPVARVAQQQDNSWVRGELLDSSMNPANNEIDAAQHRREGTQVKEVRGRILRIGRRLAFVPDASVRKPSGSNAERRLDSHTFASGGRWDGSSNKDMQRSDTNVPDAASSTSDLRSSTVTLEDRLRAGRLDVGNPDGSVGADPFRSGLRRNAGSPIDLFRSGGGGESASRPAETSSWMLLENLMLERIDRSLREDPTDDRWTIGGLLTEFDEQNFLLIRWAQRTSR